MYRKRSAVNTKKANLSSSKTKRGSELGAQNGRVQASKETSLSSSFLFANTGLEGGASMVSPVPGDVSDKSIQGNKREVKASKGKHDRRSSNNNSGGSKSSTKSKAKRSIIEKQTKGPDTFLPGVTLTSTQNDKLENNDNDDASSAYSNGNIIEKMPPLSVSDRALHMFHLPMPDCSSRPFDVY